MSNTTLTPTPSHTKGAYNRRVPLTSERTHSATGRALHASLSDRVDAPRAGEVVFFEVDGSGYGLAAARFHERWIEVWPVRALGDRVLPLARYGQAGAVSWGTGGEVDLAAAQLVVRRLARLRRADVRARGV